MNVSWHTRWNVWPRLICLRHDSFMCDSSMDVDSIVLGRTWVMLHESCCIFCSCVIMSSYMTQLTQLCRVYLTRLTRVWCESFIDVESIFFGINASFHTFLNFTGALLRIHMRHDTFLCDVTRLMYLRTCVFYATRYLKLTRSDMTWFVRVWYNVTYSFTNVRI